MKAKIFFNDVDFRIAHGRVPRGRGSWAFSLNRNNYGDESDIFWSNGAFAEARKAARDYFIAKAKAVGASHVIEVFILS